MFEAFKIGIKLSLVNNVSHGLIAMANDFGRAEHATESLRRKLAQMSAGTKMLFGGAIAIGAGASLAMAFKPAITAAKEWETARANFSLFGMTDAQNQEAFKFAQNMNIAGSTYVDNLHKMTEAQGAFRESGLQGSEALAGAKLAAPMLSKLAALSKAGGHEMSESDDKALIRAIEMSGGLKDAATFNDRANAIFKLVGSSGGMVHYEDVRAFYARGGISAKNLTDNALMKLEPILGEMKGTTAGTALMTGYNRLNGIVKLPNQIVHELVDSGLWNGKNITWNSQGGVKNMKSEGLLAGASELQTDPVAWERKYLEPMYAKMGLVTQAQKDLENGRIFGRNPGGLFSLIQRQATVIDRSPDAINKRLGINDSFNLLKNTTASQEQQAAANWKNIMTNVGVSILPNVNRGLTKLNDILTRVSDWTRDNPELVKAVAYTAMLISGVLIVGGGLMMLGGAIALLGGPITLAIAAVTLLGIAAIWIWKLVDWQAIGGWIKSAATSTAEFFNGIGSWVGNMIAKARNFLGKAADFILGPKTPDGKDGESKPSDPHESPIIRTAKDRPFKVQSALYLTASGKKAIAESTADHIATGILNPYSAGSFDSHLAQQTPGQGY